MAVTTTSDLTEIDLLAIVSVDTPLKRVAATSGGEYAGPCPFCGGNAEAYEHHVYGRHIVCGGCGIRTPPTVGISTAI